MSNPSWYQNLQQGVEWQWCQEAGTRWRVPEIPALQRLIEYSQVGLACSIQWVPSHWMHSNIWRPSLKNHKRKKNERRGGTGEGSRHGSGQSKNKAREYRHGFVWCLEPGPEIASENPQNISGMSVLKGRNLVHCSTSSHSSWLRLRTILFSIWSELVGSSCLPTLL